MITKVLIVDDSATARATIRLALTRDPEIRVVGEAEDAVRAERLVVELKPNLVTMDVMLPHRSGLDAARTIMTQSPCPILVITAADTKDPDLVYRAMQAGVLEILPKLPGPTDRSYDEATHRLIRMVKTLARVPVVRHRSSTPLSTVEPRIVQVPDAPRRVRVLAIGGSTGGPPVLADILRGLPAPFPIPIAVVQHMAGPFIKGFAEWLSKTSRHRVTLVNRSMEMAPGGVFVADADHHLRLVSENRVGPLNAPPHNHYRPSVDILFESLARQIGSETLAVLLTGMGHDGRDGMVALHKLGAITMAQEPATCAVDAMPSSAIAARAVTHIVDPKDMPSRIQSLIAMPLP